MKHNLFSKFYRLVLVLAAFSLIALSIPRAAQAASPAPATATPKTYFIQVTGVEKNNRITVTATGFPANTDFKVRVGPFQDFNKKAVQMGTVNTGSSGNFVFNVTLPGAVKDVKLVTVRLDSSSKQYSYNAFTNANSGTINSNPNAWLPNKPASPTPTPPPVVSGACQVVSTEPSGSMKVRDDFDAAWTIKNTSSKDWGMTEVDYKYVSGEKIYKYKAGYDLPKTVKPGETIKLVVDMRAPSSAGTYKTEWALASGGTYLCSLPLTITVK